MRTIFNKIPKEMKDNKIIKAIRNHVLSYHKYLESRVTTFSPEKLLSYCHPTDRLEFAKKLQSAGLINQKQVDYVRSNVKKFYL